MSKGSKNRTKDFKKYWDSPFWKGKESKMKTNKRRT
jgi:hypothetical protein